MTRIDEIKWTTFWHSYGACIIFQPLTSLTWTEPKVSNHSRTEWSIKPYPLYAGGIWKRGLSLRLDLPSTLIRREKGAFRKHSSNRRNLKTPTLRFRVDKKHFENGAFRKRWRHDSHVISLTEFSSNTNPKGPAIVAFSNSSGVVSSVDWA